MVFLYEFGFILGGVSLLILLLGTLGTVNTVSLGSLSLLAVLATITLLYRHIKMPSSKDYTISLWPLVPFCVFILILLPVTLLPPTARDELIMHLAIPKLYLENGGISGVPFMVFSYAPMNLELLYLVHMAFGSDTLPKVVHLFFAVLTGLIIYIYLSEKFGKRQGTTGAILYLTTPIVAQLSTTAYIDLGLAFYSTLALVALLKWRESDYRQQWLVYSALSTGLALGTKYSALVVLFVLCPSVIFLYSRGTREQTKAVKLGVLYMFISLAVFSPWLIRNYILKGDPVFPLATRLFANGHSPGSGLHITKLPPLLMRKLLYGEDLWYTLLTPLRIFWEGKDGSHQYFDGVLNPLYLIFIPLAFKRPRDKAVTYMLLFSATYFYIAFFTVDLVIRYLLPIIPALIILMVYGFNNTMASKRFRYVAIALMAVTFIFNGRYIATLYKRHSPLKYMTGSETKRQYLSRMLPDYAATAFANHNLPTDTKVLFLFTGDRGYYWEREYLYWDRGGTKVLSLIKESKSAVELRDGFTAFGITHLFIKDPLFERFMKDNLNGNSIRLLNDFFRTYASRLYTANGFSIYEITNGGPERSPNRG